MKILIFDTETGGINPLYNDILQLSYQIVNLNTRTVEKEVNHYFPWPEDKRRVQWGAIQVNGLTEAYLATKTLSERYDAVMEFYDDMAECQYIVAHNGDFDRKFIDATASREGIPTTFKKWKTMIDTMKTTTNLCCIPCRKKEGYKWPKLIELAEFLEIDTDDINLHDSSADVELTKRCFMTLVDDGFYTL